MKTLTKFLAAAVIITGQVYAQTLSNDPALGRMVTKSIRYPALAHQQQKVSEAYVNFKVDSKGKITNVAILNASRVDPSFQQEIKRVW